MISENKIDSKFNIAINNYYKLKKQYEKPYNKFINDLLKNEELNNNEKKIKVSEYKNKCVNCKSLGGTIFNKQGNNLIVYCGNQDNPCKLNIHLQRGHYDNIYNILDNINQNINHNKIETIKTKYNFLFGFTNEETTIKNFNLLKTKIVSDVKNYQDVFQKFILLINNQEKKGKIFNETKKILSLIDSFKILIKQYEDTKENNYLKEATELYIDNIVKTANSIRNNKYIRNEIIHDEDEKTYHLIQKSYNAEELLLLIPGSKNKIINYKL